MGKIMTTAAAIVVLTASWVCAGSFQGLADAAAVKPLTSPHLQAGTLTKVDFKSNMKTHSDMELESDIPVAEPVAASSGPNMRPAVAFRERPAAAMAPPPAAGADVGSRVGTVAENREDGADLGMDLDTDLVLKPTPKAQDATPSEPKPAVEKKPVEQKTGVSGVSVEKKKPASQARKPVPSEKAQFLSKSGKPIRKVHTLSQNQWNVPAGSRDARYSRPATARNSQPARVHHNRVAAHRDNRHQQMYQAHAMPEEYMTAEPRRTIATPPMAERFVRDGVTIKLAPNAAADSPYPDAYGDDSTGSDILSAATEIIGLPFAFISSLF